MKITLSGLREYNISVKKLLTLSTKLRKLSSKKSLSDTDLVEINKFKDELILLEKHVSFLRPFYEGLTEEKLRESLILPSTSDKASSVTKYKSSKKDAAFLNKSDVLTSAVQEIVPLKTEVPILIEKFESLDVSTKEDKEQKSRKSADKIMKSPDQISKIIKSERQKKIKTVV